MLSVVIDEAGACHRMIMRQPRSFTLALLVPFCILIVTCYVEQLRKSIQRLNHEAEHSRGNENQIRGY